MHVELRFPLLTLGIQDVEIRSRRKRRDEPAGPSVIVARDCGLAIDTALRDTAGDPHLWPPHGLRHQLWYLQPTGIAGDVMIISAANGLALDSGPSSTDPSLTMWDPHGEAWQRWRLEPTPDGGGTLIRAVHSGRYLSAHDKSEPRWKPWFEDRDPQRFAQQWTLAVPHSPSN